MTDWIDHVGGACPVGLEDTWVSVRLRTGSEVNPRIGRLWRWEHHYTAGDIVAYRVASGPGVHVGEAAEVV